MVESVKNIRRRFIERFGTRVLVYPIFLTSFKRFKKKFK